MQPEQEGIVPVAASAQREGSPLAALPRRPDQRPSRPDATEDAKTPTPRRFPLPWPVTSAVTGRWYVVRASPQPESDGAQDATAELG